MKKINQKGFSLVIVFVLIAIIIATLVYIFLNFNNSKNIVKNQPEARLGDDVLIGFSMVTLKEERWQNDKREFIKKAEEMGATVDLQIAESDTATQINHIKKMIVSGVDVIVIIPYDSTSLTEVIKDAHNAGIKVISYDRLVNNANADLYVSFDNEKVGEYQAQHVIDSISKPNDEKIKIAYVGGSELDNNAFLLKIGSMRVLQPLIDAGKLDLVFDKFTHDWNPDIAYGNIKEFLAKDDNHLDGVVAANDGTAFGVITALKESNLEGKVSVSGQDAELSAIKRIIDGTQIVTVYKPISKLASSSAELAIKLAKGIDIDTLVEINDGTFDIPSVLLEPVVVTKDNISDTVIKDGYHSKDDVYGNF